MSKYLGNNYWLLNDGRVFNSLRQTIIREVPANFKYDKTIGNYELYEGRDFWKLEEGKQMVIIDFCENIKRHKRSTYATFEKFETLDMSWRKYPHLPETKKTNGFYHFENNFIKGNPYIMLIEIDHLFPDSVRIIKSKEIHKNYEIQTN